MCDINPMFELPVCEVCKKTFRQIKSLDVHMKIAHKESDHERIERRTRMATYAANYLKRKQEVEVKELEEDEKKMKDFKCDKCEKVVVSKEELKIHMQDKHKSKVIESESVSEFNFKSFPSGYSIKKNKGKQSKDYDKAFDENENGVYSTCSTVDLSPNAQTKHFLKTKTSSKHLKINELGFTFR